MSPRRDLLILGVGLAILAGLHARGELSGQPENAKPARTDFHGDALPPGASARLGTVRWRHGGPVFFVGLAARGSHLVTASQDGTYRVWDAASGKEIRRFGKPLVERLDDDANDWRSRLRTVFYSGVGDMVALSPDGRLLAAGEQMDTQHVRIWDVDTGKELWHARLKAPATGLAFSSDSKLLVAQDWRQVRRWDARTGKEPPARLAFADSGIGNIQSEAPLFAFSPDGRFLAGTVLSKGGEDIIRIVRLWDTASGKTLRRIRGDKFQFGCLAFSPDGKLLALPSAGDGTIRLWEVATGKETRTIRGTPRIAAAHALAFSPDGRVLASRGYDRVIRLWDVDRGTELRSLSGPFDPAGASTTVTGHPGGVSQGLVFSADGKVLFSASRKHLPRRWNVATGKELLPVGGHTEEITAVVVSPDGRTVTTRAGDRTLRQWDRPSGKELRRFQLPETAYLPALAPDGRTVAFGDQHSVHIWDLTAGKEIRRWPFPGPRINDFHPSWPRELTFAVDGKLLVCRSYDENVRIWDVTTGKELCFLTGLRTEKEVRGILPQGQPIVLVSHLALSPDGATLARVETNSRVQFPRIGSDFPRPPKPPPNTGAVRLLHIPTGQEIRRFEVGAETAAFSFAPGGRSLATAGKDGTVSVWETATGSRRCRLDTGASTLAFAPDGRALAVCGPDRQIQVWDLRTGTQVARFAGHQGAVLTLAWTPDGTGLISGSDDTTALAWEVPTAAGAGRAARPQAERMETLWAALADADAGKAFDAMRALYRSPEPAVRSLRARVKPVERPDAARVKRAIADLNSARFPARQQALRELERLGELAQPALRDALTAGPPLEVRRRIEELLRQQPSKALPAGLLRGLRTVEVLEWLGTPEARRTLEGIAGGAPGARLTRESQAALQRLDARAVVSR